MERKVNVRREWPRASTATNEIRRAVGSHLFLFAVETDRMVQWVGTVPSRVRRAQIALPLLGKGRRQTLVGAFQGFVEQVANIPHFIRVLLNDRKEI